jgi:hypothetical protein
MLAMLMSMGFDRDLSITALAEADVPNVESAIDWIMQHNESTTNNVNTSDTIGDIDRSRQTQNNFETIHPQHDNVHTSLKQREEEYKRDFEKKEQEKINIQDSQLSAINKKESHDSKREA